MLILPLQAPGIAADLMTFFKSAGMASNVTSPGGIFNLTLGC
jgi:hypothetical protein